MQDYKPNSHRSKEAQKETAEERKIQKVVSGTAKVKKNGTRKFTDIFIAEDISSVKSYIFMDVLVPALKKAVSDIFTNGIDMILYGESGRSKSRSSGGHKISYSKYYDEGRRDERRYTSSRSSSRFDYDDILFETRGDAEAVRSEMEDVIERYGFVTVSDMYDMAEQTAPYTGNKYGWTSIRNAEVKRVRDGYVLELPRAIPLD